MSGTVLYITHTLDLWEAFLGVVYTKTYHIDWITYNKIYIYTPCIASYVFWIWNGGLDGVALYITLSSHNCTIVGSTYLCSINWVRYYAT